MFRNTLGILGLVAAAAAMWASYRAWGERTPLGQIQDIPRLAIGRLDQRNYFTWAGWRYRRAAGILYLVAIALLIAWSSAGAAR